MCKRSSWKEVRGVLVKKVKVAGYGMVLVKLPSRYMSLHIPMGDGEDKKMFDELVYYNQRLYNGKDEQTIKGNVTKFIKEYKARKCEVV
jgi:hypothetical protein